MKDVVFLTGYTEFITDDFIVNAFPDCRVIISGSPSVETSAKNNISVYKEDVCDKNLDKLFHTYDFDKVVYFSKGIEPFGHADGRELERLSIVLGHCDSSTRVVYFCGPEHDISSPYSFIEHSAKEMCKRYISHIGGINVVVSPWVYSISANQMSLTSLFKEGKHEIAYSQSQKFSFLASEDMALLLFRMYENWEQVLEPMYIPNVFVSDINHILNTILAESEGDDIEFVFNNSDSFELQAQSLPVLRSRFMWFPVYSFEEDLVTIISNFRKQKSGSFVGILDKINSDSIIVKILELVFGAAVTELLLKLSGNNIQFAMIDFRLLFVVLFGTMYNMPMGMAAAGIASISLIYAYIKNGTGFIALFYNPTNWLPFIAYFTIGAICGYVRNKDRNLLDFSHEENQSLEDRYHYLEGIIDDVIQEKKEYKQQIIGSRDSFGKIFEITQKLNDSNPRQIISQACEIIETVMGNDSVAIYYTPGQSSFGRLAVSSNANMPGSMAMASYYEKLATVKAGEAWVNKDLEADYPHYMYGITRDGKYEAIILIQNVSYNKMSLYYENLFRVLCGLISNALLRAMDYMAATRTKRSVMGLGGILIKEYFFEELGIALKESEKKRSTHICVKIDREDTSISAMEKRLKKCVRTNDIMGLCDGEIYIILMQADDDDMPIINKRFSDAEIKYRVLNSDEQFQLIESSEAQKA